MERRRHARGKAPAVVTATTHETNQQQPQPATARAPEVVSLHAVPSAPRDSLAASTAPAPASGQPLLCRGNSLPAAQVIIRAHRNPRLACHLARLAEVEVQSIMHFLDRTSLIRLARCSHCLHADADSEAAWKHQPALEVMIRLSDLPPSTGERIRQSLLAHLPTVSVRVNSGLREEHIVALLDMPRVTCLQVRASRSLPAEQWSRLLRSTAMRDLCELQLRSCRDLPVDFFDQLGRLPHLHTLRLEDPLNRDDSLRALPRLAQLTTLQLRDDSHGPSRLDAVAQCSRLSDLQLVGPRLQGPRFLSFFTSPHMRRLQRLRLDFSITESGLPPVPEEDLVVAFRALTELRQLCFGDATNVDSLLAAVDQAPVLEELTIETSDSNPRLPSPAALAALLARAPALLIRLEVSADSKERYADLAAANPLRLQLFCYCLPQGFWISLRTLLAAAHNRSSLVA